MTPIRVIFDGHHIGRQQTGNETYARELARALAEREDIELILTVDRARRHAARGLSPAVLRTLPANPIGRLAAFPLLARQLGAQLVHTMYYLPPGSTRRTIVSVHDVSFERFPEFFSRAQRAKNRVFVGDAVRRAAGICTLTNHSKAEIVEVYGVNPERIHVVPCGVAGSFSERPTGPRTATRDALRLLAVGSLQPRKNLLRLVSAVRSLASMRPVHLSLIGPEGYQADEIRAAMGPDAPVKFLGYVSEARLVEAYRDADVFVYPSIYEGFGLPVIEAMACGTPVVTSTGGSLPEVAGSAAIIVDPYDPGSIADGIARAADDEQLRSRLIDAGRARAGEFTWPAAAAAAAAAYRRILAS